VTATAVDKSTGKSLGKANLQYSVWGEPSLSLSIPSGSAGPDVSYTFEATPTNIPSGAMYTWYVNGTDVQAGGIDETSAEAPAGSFEAGKKYSVQVVATWTANGTSRSAKASGTFVCAAATTPTSPPANPGTEPEQTEGEQMTCSVYAENNCNGSGYLSGYYQDGKPISWDEYQGETELPIYNVQGYRFLLPPGHYKLVVRYHCMEGSFGDIHTGPEQTCTFEVNVVKGGNNDFPIPCLHK